MTLDINLTRFRAVVSDSRCDFLLTDEFSLSDLRQEAVRLSLKEFSMALLTVLTDEVEYRFIKGFQNELSLMKFL